MCLQADCKVLSNTERLVCPGLSLEKTHQLINVQTVSKVQLHTACLISLTAASGELGSRSSGAVLPQTQDVKRLAHDDWLCCLLGHPNI